MLSRKWILRFAFTLLLIIPFASLSAQGVPTVSVALPAQMRNIIDESIFDDFESAHGVQVYVNYTDAQVPPPSAGMDAFLAALTTYASAADVIYVSTSEMSREATAGGYLLDLSPLTNTDAALNPDDFFPAAWQSVQWDNGVWALPLTVDITMLIYDPDTFDKAGLAYPNERWTMDDIATAAEALTQYDANGNVSVPGLSSFGSTASLFRSLYGKNFYDDAGNPAFTDPALEDMLTKWKELQDEGVVGSTFTGGGSNQVPMRIMGSFGLSFPGQQNATPPVAVALPGGRVGLEVTGLAVSSGTQQPELAYALAEYLTTRPELASGIFGGSPARQSMVGVQPEQSDNGRPGGGGARFAFGGASSPEAQAALKALLPSALTLAEQTYSSYINVALSAMNNDGVDAHTALQNAEATAVADQQAALDQQSSVSLVVATPVPPVVLQNGEIALKFGIQSFGPQLPNEAAWRQLITDFAANDLEVGDVQIDTDFGGAQGYAERDDCFYLSSNAVPSLDSTTILNLDPYLDTDPNFDPNDVVGGLMSQLQKDDRTWAYPLVIQAQTMNYNVNIFNQAGVPLPENGWTIDQFNDALRTLRDYLDKEPFVPQDLNGEALMMLMAAYGGLPIDYRTTPATLNFTDPATIDAVQQVLDLVKNGYIKYQSMATGGGFRIVTVDGASEDAIGTDSIGGFRRFLGGSQNVGRNPVRLVSYPSGVYTGASYTIGTGYISATAQNPDACYRWLSYIAQHVDVLGSMPARLSQINDPAFAAALGDNIPFYQQYAQLLSDPNTVIFPSAAGGNANVSDFIVQFWLNRAFDNYISNNADLTAELTDAQTYATAFNDCVAALPPSSQPQASGPGTISINQGIIDCASTADPSLSTLFGAAGGG